MAETMLQWFADRVVPREWIERFLDPAIDTWARFDPELGYLLRTGLRHDGVDGCWTISHYDGLDERRMIHYADRPCRVNTYGDSFTQCHQVSDGETWQEVLAAHLGEPIRNFGIGGFGVYQAWRRMRREEARSPAPYVILNIWGDDHIRSVMPSRYLFIHEFFKVRHKAQKMFHANPWAHVAFDLDTGRPVERENPCPTGESLLEVFSDADRLWETFGPAPTVQLRAWADGVRDADKNCIRRLAEIAEIDLDPNDDHDRRARGQEVLWRLGYRATEMILDQAHQWARDAGKKLMVLLSYGSGQVADAINGKPRADRRLVEKLQRTGTLHVEVLSRHVADYGRFNLSVEDYLKRYYIGHYNPRGNFWFAFAIKDDLVAWLDPKLPPPAIYQASSLNSLRVKARRHSRAG